ESDDAMMTEDDAMMAEGDDAMMAEEAPAALPATGGVKSGLPLWSIVIAAGTVLAGLGVYLRRRNEEKIL
ncbi:MAG TPA: LPXTG cell wall anchor domain-containing protein, partial [Anaerolineae bacterium]|nr:LPXTG cell wall anchor domain-containing protein [Anaerolineae bacterium]